jgi:hypothetical protein
MTATDTTTGDRPVAAGDDPAGGRAGAGAAGRLARRLDDDRLVGRLALAVTLLPFVVAAVVLLVVVGGDYHPASDHALTELQVRSVGQDDVLVGLYSRDTWNHPGPALFWLLAPFYRLTGGMSVGVNVGALAINGASVAGMAVVARRRGGTGLLLVALLAAALVMRTLGAEFLHDPWNCYVTVLPYGLLLLLAWTAWRGDLWALPAAAAVTAYLAHTHVGFAPLAAPLLAWAGLGALVSVVRRGERSPGGAGVRPLAGAVLASLGVLALAAVPLVLDWRRPGASNLREIVDYFRHPDEPTAGLADGVRVMLGQWSGVPEWLTVKRPMTWLGESPHLSGVPIPWVLLVFAVATALLRRRRVAGAVALSATVGLALVVGAVAVGRTIGPAFDYRLRWTFMPAMVGAVVIGWAGWRLAADRWPGTGERALRGVALAALVVLGGVNVVTAATAGTPQDLDSEAVASITDQVLEGLPDEPEGTVEVRDALHAGAWYARGLVLQLERRGVDVGVPASVADEYGRHRVADPAEVGDVLVVVRDQWVDAVAERPGMRKVAEWWAVPPDEAAPLLAELDRLDAELEAGRLTLLEHAREHRRIFRQLTDGGRAQAYRVVVFRDEGAVAALPTEPAG